jgi:lambda repressor-like predicted transcriptional regulator
MNATEKKDKKDWNVHVDVARILEGMKRQGWGVAACCVNCGVNNKTLSKILDGKVPKRLDAFYRVLDGLKIPMGEALIHGSTPKTAQIHLLPNRRRDTQVS